MNDLDQLFHFYYIGLVNVTNDTVSKVNIRACKKITVRKVYDDPRLNPFITYLKMNSQKWHGTIIPLQFIHQTFVPTRLPALTPIKKSVTCNETLNLCINSIQLKKHTLINDFKMTQNYIRFFGSFCGFFFSQIFSGECHVTVENNTQKKLN